MPELKFRDIVVPTSVGDRTAMVITPERPTVIPLSAIPTHGEAATMSATDARILAEARARLPDVKLCIFRGANDDESAYWRFDEAISDAAGLTLATELLRGQLIVYREMLKAGIYLFLHVDWGQREAAWFRDGCEALAVELDLKRHHAATANAVDTVDVWVLRNLTFFFSLGFAKVIGSILPGKLALMEKRMDRINRMAAKLR